MAEYEQATPEQKLNIAAYFIMSSPTGEVGEVVKDVKVLVNDADVFTEDAQRRFLKDYNTQHYVMANAPNANNKILVTPYGQVSDNEYLDPSTGKVFVFDHLKREFTEETDKKQDLRDDIDKYRRAIETSVNGFVSNGYKEGKAAASVYGTDDGKITICISARNVRLSSFWTGGMRSKYSLDVSKTGQTDLSGTIKVNVHYFEDGNVQLNTDISKTAKVEVGDPAATAKAVAQAIEKIESEFQNNLEEFYVSMHMNTFKALRRVLPISGTMMNWSSGVHSLASSVTK